MDKREYLLMGLEGVTTHKLRSFLTALGIILGVASVIAMLSIGEGAKRAALEKFKDLGIENIIVRDKELSEEELEEVRAKFSLGLTMEDAAAIQSIIGTVSTVAPQAELEVEARFEDRSLKSTLVGVTPILQQILNYRIRTGAFLTDTQNQQEQRVCILGAEAAQELFPVAEPVGNLVKLDDQWFEVVGVMESRSLYSETVGELAARNLNQDIYIPLLSFLRRFDKEEQLASEVNQLTVRVKDSEDVVRTSAVIRRILKRRHFDQDDFDIVVPFQLLQQEEKERRMYNLVLGSIAAISLLVGGIGIMNIMLATVLERTREIGVRRALGARRKDILLQFLLEAVGLSLIGGLIGVVLGIGMSLFIGSLGEFDSVVSPYQVILAFLVSGLVGVASGTFPARRAANVNPIDALRYE